LQLTSELVLSRQGLGQSACSGLFDQHWRVRAMTGGMRQLLKAKEVGLHQPQAKVRAKVRGSGQLGMILPTFRSQTSCRGSGINVRMDPSCSRIAEMEGLSHPSKDCRH